MTRLFMLCAALVCLVGCTVNVGHRQEFVYERYPVYPVAEMERLENISGAEMMPYKELAELVRKSLEDGAKDIRKEEAARILAEADEKREEGRQKVRRNIEKLLRWGRKNEATVRSYNEYARGKNERIKLYEKLER